MDVLKEIEKNFYTENDREKLYPFETFSAPTPKKVNAIFCFKLLKKIELLHR